jgi:drug/metabolite transporter (DMT)-like permease
MDGALLASVMQTHLGEIISLGVAVSWTITALCFEYAGRRMHSTISLNIIRLVMALVLLALTLLVFTGHMLPQNAGNEAWLWLGVSGLVGYVFGDYCLFSSYLVIGSRFGQLFMTLAPPSAALGGWLILGEHMQGHALLGMFVTMFGIGLSIIGRGGDQSGKLHLSLPLKGVLFGIGAGMGQGFGLVFSKLGMNYYIQHVDTSNALAVGLMPFASTEIRVIFGITGFIVIMLLTRSWPKLVASVKDAKGMAAATGGTIFGPFLGVSFSLMAVRYTETGIASTLMALTPIIILLPTYLIYKQKISLKEIAGAVISVVGVSLFFI